MTRYTEVREQVRGQEHGGIKLRDVERRMGWSTAVVKDLISEGLLPARTAINPKNRCPQTVVDESDLKSFNAEYVSLHRLAKEIGVHFNSVSLQLSAAEVYPDNKFDNVRATFYRRANVNPVLFQSGTTGSQVLY
ncbi:hypothetical protein [Rhodovibrio sodomensis]|uniref:hypothetical protein n=1 Tax=Rhodovibrio sodomensis TaxID=1088 RepID=UPI001903BDF4|nr:hypothetical protein [Rhodovibrio sodomensis]